MVVSIETDNGKLPSGLIPVLSMLYSRLSLCHYIEIRSNAYSLKSKVLCNYTKITKTRKILSHAYLSAEGAGIAYSVLLLATGWTVRGSNPSGGEIFRTRPDRPWGQPSLLYNGYRVFFPGVKRPRRGAEHPPPSSAEVKERVQL
jgi:hypothetical protein